MIGDSIFFQSRGPFADQFEAEGSDYLFRKNGRGTAIKVNAGERDAFLAGFDRDMRVAFWGMMAAVGTMAMIFFALFPADAPDDDGFLVPSFFVGFGLMMVVFFVAFLRAQDAPVRALTGRMTAGAALTKDEFLRRHWQKVTYGQMAGFAAAGALFLLQIDFAKSLGRGMNLLFLAGGVFVEVVTAYAAWRKWRFERSKNADAGDRPRWE